ncbi:MAG TPA: DUF6491 family protein [Allosphingosinicella sp.]|jgi:hypothetical protein
MNKLLLAFAAGAASVAGIAAPAPAETPATTARETSIPFLHIGRMRTFRAIDEHTLYIEAQRRQWYRLTTFGSCINLPWARNIGVDTRGQPDLDRTSVLLVDGERCALRSVVRADEPPSRRELRRQRRAEEGSR